MNEHLTHLVTNRKTLDAKPSKISAALKLNTIAIVDEEWLDECLKSQTIVSEETHLLGGKVIKAADRDRQEYLLRKSKDSLKKSETMSSSTSTSNSLLSSLMRKNPLYI